ncbi:MAG: bifunctional metallophosphatase/5'-nucleotidase [Bacteroidetes bacterium]|nr:MAG: bifunctional metallophosphatase/5'-nucleotidase [Bacteroidota bacterium]REK07036.1 MAG: bifunctional metallophosphatase/5'-nucleotidase [Bacteroidota bacterium]REK33617.1 MAG: bifunctional metallophosphatase/5'-nucleotidase [Bacteroidota bacterium]REK48602.1 MAG: bifunctional metallophosphatase/5'-nucleotidase [Bacteroidota bacterium]
MINNRRDFIKTFGSGLALLGLGLNPLELLAKREIIKLTILHTNDVHSRIDPFPANDPKFPGMGGAARRAAILKKIRSLEPNVLLFDAGDIFQGTPYFNQFGGELELRLMSEMGYDAATIGNHDFDNGIENLQKQMTHANFSFISSNYNFNDTALEGKILPYKVFRRGELTIGVFGLGIELQGLVDTRLYGNTKYNDPLSVANQTAKKLKFDLNCDLVVCLSHLGLRYTDKKISDELIAKSSNHIDLIIGGHTHTFLDVPLNYKNAEGNEVLVAQVGWAGIKLGRVDFYFDVRKSKKDALGCSVKISEKTIAI